MYIHTRKQHNFSEKKIESKEKLTDGEQQKNRDREHSSASVDCEVEAEADVEVESQSDSENEVKSTGRFLFTQYI